MITQTYTISTIKQSTPPIVKMSQYDHGSRTITFSVVDGSGQAVVLTGKTVRVEGTRLDGHAFAEDCTVSGNTASFTDTSDMTNAPGAHPAELVIESDGDRLGTMNFVISVETAAMDENADITEEDVSLFEQLLGSIEDATGAVEAEKTAALSAIDDDKDAALLAIAQGLASGSPLVVDAVADMTDQTAVYLYSGSESGYTAGNFYFWNGSAWVSGGTYGNPTVDAALSDSSVNPVQNKVVSAAVSSLKSDLSVYETLNDNRFVFSKNLFDSAAAVNGYYVNNNNGTLIAYNGWFATYYIPVDDSTDYSFVIRESGQGWKKPSGAYYAFYDSDYNYTHGGISAADANCETQSGDAYFRISYYSGAINASMVGTSTDMDEYIGTRLPVFPYYIAPKYESDPYNGLICVFDSVANPYYSLRVSGNRISVTQDGIIQGAFVKFDSIVMIAGDGFKTKSWETFKTDIQSDAYIEITSAYDGTPDVLRLLPEYGIVYNYNTNTYHVRNKVYITNLTKHDVIVFYNDANSVPSGVLYEAWVGNHKQGIEKYIRTIENRETELLNYGSNFVFAFATDCHWYFDDSAYHNYTNEMIEELRRCIGFDCYINGGDSIYYGTKYKLNGVASMRKAFEPEHDDYIYCIGNHDYNGISTGEIQNSSWMFDADGIESLCLRKMKNITRPSGARYYYRDFEDKKIRVIVLDTSDLDISFDTNGDIVGYDPLVTFAVRQNQLEWLRTTALDCPSDDWGVIIIMHVGLYTAEDGFVDNNTLINRSYLIQLLSAYVDKSSYSYSDIDTAHGNYFAVSASGTFANTSGHLIGVWSGHAHADGYCNKDGFNAIQTECGYPDSASRVVGTIDEICVDCVCVDLPNKTITLKRFGSGSDREYSFT